MGCNMRGILFMVCVAAVMVYLIVAAMEDTKSMEVTRRKHLIGFIPTVIVWILFAGERNACDILMTILFAGIWLLCGKIGIYGMADGFVFANLALLFGAVGGVVGNGLVILIMVIAGFSGMGEILIRRMFTMKNFKEKRKIAFVPHIFVGYAVIVIVGGVMALF